MEFTSTIFGGRKLLYNGYIYMKDKVSADANYLRCEKRGICSSRMIKFIASGLVKKIDLTILGTEENILMLARYPHWFCDGTFDSAPIGYQLYTIHVLLNDTVTILMVF